MLYFGSHPWYINFLPLLQLDYNSTGQLAYVWETSTTSTTSILSTELALFIIIPVLVIFLAVLLAIGLPSVLELDCTWGYNGLYTVLCAIGGLELNTNQILIERINIPLQSNIRLTVLLVILGISIVIGIIAAVKRKSSISRYKYTCSIFTAIAFIGMSFHIIILSAAFLPLVMFTVIYPVEIISTLSFITAIIAGIITAKRCLSWLIRKNSSYKSGNKSRKAECYYYTCCTVAALLCYGLVPIAFYLLLILYLEMLNSLSESPTSQLFKLLLSFVPSVLTTIIGIMLSKKLGQEKKPNISTKESDIELKTMDNIRRAEEGEPRRRPTSNSRMSNK
jgi:hypothetical protein